MDAKASATSTELSILDYLSNLRDPNAQHIMELLGTFHHEGPNGKHLCMVFKPMGSTAASLVEELPENQPKMYGKRQRYPKWVAKRILLHALRGLAFLHQNGVVHGDVQPGNLLFSINNLDSVEEEELRQDETSGTVPLERVDGKIDRWAPTNLYLKQSLHDRVQVDSTLHVKLSGLGAGKPSHEETFFLMWKYSLLIENLSNGIPAAFWSSSPPDDTVTPVGLRAPELIMHQQPFGSAIDIWSFGCLIFEFLTGRALFAVGTVGLSQEDRDEADDDHLTQLNDIIQPLPDSMMAAWPRASMWYGPERQPLMPYGGEVYIHKPLEDLFAENKPDSIDDGEAAVVCELIRQILKYDPAERPAAVDLLKHPWFSD
jgi:non-specific serine/threonine protein kinase